MIPTVVLTSFKYIILVALCAASISYTITFAGIFKWLRKILSKWGEWFDELIHCPYCFGHYVVLTIMLTTSNLSSVLVPITASVVYNFLFTWFCIVCVMSLLHAVMLIAYKPVAELETFRKLKEKKQQLNNQK